VAEAHRLAEAQRLSGDGAQGPISIGPAQTRAAEIEWTPADTPARWAKLFGFSVRTLNRRFKDGSIRPKKLSTKSYQIAIDDLPAMHQPKFRNVPTKPAN
jgi:hypothetical protein